MMPWRVRRRISVTRMPGLGQLPRRTVLKAHDGLLVV
jgi:hypothetical protein